MKIALVGNNDGPLILARAMRDVNRHPVCIGLQNPVSKAMYGDYMDLIREKDFFSDFTEARLLEVLKAYDLDILINCFCNFKFKTLLNHYTVLNVHLAPLPRYRGRHPLHWALINGEKEFGFTVHKMDKDFDAGEIYWQQRVPITLGMSVAELRSVLMKELSIGFGSFLEAYGNDEITPLSNPDTEATYAPKRRPDDSLLTEWHDCDTIYRKVMALRSGDFKAYLNSNGVKIPVVKAKLEEGATTKTATTEGKVLIERVHADGISLICKDGKRIRLYGFDPSAHLLLKNQEII